VSATHTTVPTTCGNSTGRVIVTAAGGTPGYTYTWSPNVSTVDSAINLAVGTYNVTVKDSKGCTFATSATVISTSNFSVSPGVQRNVLCFGGNTGAAYVTVTGGTTPYTYTWSPNVSTNDSAVNLAAGTYTVTVHDAGGCSGTSSFTITQPSTAVSATSITVPATCTSSTGKVIFTTAGGTPGYTYIWSPNVSTADSAKNLAAGTYQLTITDSKGCTFTTSANVGTTGGIIVSSGAQTKVNCFGATTGVAHVSVTGGTTPYTFTWSPNVSTLDSATGLAAGTYTVTVHDVNGCSGTASFTITQPATALSATNTTVSTTCGNSNGRIVITAAGGTPGYTYTWSPNVSTVDSAINLAVGTYNVTVKDSKGCTFASSANVASSSGFSVSQGVQKNVLCFGGNTGAAYVTATGGTTPYTYTWSPNVSTVDSAVNLAAGTYTVTVHDAGGCSGTSSFTITQPPTALSATNTTVPDACGSNTGKVYITSSGGTPAYIYTWSPNVSTNDSAINLANGTYLVTVTDANHCTAAVSATIGVVAGPTVSLSSQQNVSCNGGTNGKIITTVSGGTGPFTYTWSPAVSTKDSAVNLAQGTYTVTVKDANNCTSTLTVTITQPGPFVVTDTVTSAYCGNNNGKILFNVSGATPGYTYTWSPNVSTTDSAVNLAAGNYSVTVKDANNCTSIGSATVTSIAGVSASLASHKNVLCFGGNTGSANISASGGVLPYTYTWSPNVSTVDSAINLAAGTYTVTVRDANNCTGIVTVTITQPSSALSATQTTSPAYCGNSNGKVYITPSGGTAGYTYTWSPNVSGNDSAINLTAGTYLVTVTDANQCTATVSATVLPVAGPTVSLASEQDVSCNGGSNGKIFITVSGGVGPFVYTWSPSVSTNDSAVGLSLGTYSVTVKDANNCTSSLSVTVNQPAVINVSTTTVLANCGVSNGSATAIATGGVNPLSYQWSVGTSTTAVDSGLPAGSYTVTVRDANHCTALATATISNIGAPTATVSSQVNVSCHGGSTGKIAISVSGGTAPYGYTWSPTVSTIDSAVNLTAGTYIVTVNDASNCIAVVSATITQPQALSATVQSGNADCGVSDGWAKITVTGGTGSYTYAWSVPQTTDSITGLAGGTYYVTVTDSLGCPLVDSVVVGTNSGPLTPTITADGPLIFCQGGSVTLTSSATTGNTWSTGATTQSITVTSSGTFTVTQTVGSCTSAPSISVTVAVNPIPPAPTITASGPLSFCQGGNVTLTSSATSGNLWNDNEITQSIIVSAAGTYTVSDTQAGCPSLASAPITVSIIAAPAVVINASQPSLCPSSGSDTLDATTSSATAYLWSTSSTQPSIIITAPGTYKVTVTVNGCVGYDSIIVNTQPLLGTLTLPDSFYVCPGDTVAINATTINATSYIWSGVINASTPVIAADSEGVYYIKVSNNCGSLNTSTIVSFKDCDCRVVMPNAFTPNGDGKNDYFLPEFDCADPKSLVIRIYDRWGEKVFETTDLNGQWDGTYKGAIQPSGVYMYYVEFVGYANNTEKDYKLMGTLTLMR
jgi:gliding motility-associated-like protein